MHFNSSHWALSLTMDTPGVFAVKDHKGDTSVQAYKREDHWVVSLISQRMTDAKEPTFLRAIIAAFKMATADNTMEFEEEFDDLGFVFSEIEPSDAS